MSELEELKLAYAECSRQRNELLNKLKSHAQQEPVAWMYQCSADSSGPVLMQHKKDWAESGSGLWTETPLYTSPPAQQALDKMAENVRELGLNYEPVWNNLPSNKDVEDAMRLKRLSQLAEQPAQRTWVGLTFGQFHHILQNYKDIGGAMGAVEKTLREQNT